MSDKRGSERTATDFVAHLISEKLNVSIRVVEVSASGARLVLPPGLFLPKTFVLKARELGRDRPVEVVWRNRTQAGVRF